MKKSLYRAIIIFCLLGITAAKADSTPELISSHGDWNVYSFVDNGGKACFMSTQPTKQEGNYKKRGEVFMFITRWSSDKDKNVVSISNGYTFKNSSNVVLKIDDKSYKLFTQGEMAWTKDQETDNSLTDDIKGGSSLTVNGFSQFDTETNDTYSLKGSADAHRDLVKACAS